MRASARLLFILALAASAAACGKPVDLTKGLLVQNVSTGWYDAGVVDGQNKLVPSISFSLKNASDQTLSTLQVNAVFHRVNEPKDEWGTGFLTAVGSEGLPPEMATSTFTIKSQLGYKGTDPRETLLHNSQFVDAMVVLLAKYGSAQWTKVGEFPIARQLITHQ
jgi:hypothetical protein